MKSTGMSRQIDELGRFVLPVEIRRSLHINLKDYLEIYTDNDRIILKKRMDSCMLCGAAEDLVQLQDAKHICRSCLEHLKTL